MPDRPELRLENIVRILASLKDRFSDCTDIDLIAQKVQDLSIIVYAASQVGLATAVVDPETGLHILDTKAYVQLTGYSSDELEVTPLEKIFCSGEGRPVSRQSKFRFSETSIVSKDGRIIPVEAGFGTGKYNGRDVTVVYLTDINERKLFEKELAEEKQMRVEMDASMRTVGFIAHDMANCLAVFEALKVMPVEEVLKNPVLLDGLKTNSGHLADIIRSLQNFAHGRPDDLPKYTDVKSVADEVVSLVSAKYARAGVLLDCMFDEGCTVNVQQVGLKRAIDNLLENALEAVVEANSLPDWEGQKTVWFSVARDDSNVYIVIKDGGIGIKHEDIRKIFALYTTKSKDRPSGYGLSSVYSFAVRNKGSAAVSSKGLGKGATFTVRLPYVP